MQGRLVVVDTNVLVSGLIGSQVSSPPCRIVDEMLHGSFGFLLSLDLLAEYRKVLLRDPQLPEELLPASWHGLPAYQLCRNLYRGLHERADDYLSALMETADGPLPPPGKNLSSRFGGLVTN